MTLESVLQSSVLQSQAVLVPRPDWGTLQVSGPDRAAWLNGIVTCDVTAVVPGQGAWGLLLSKQGKIEAELQVVGAKDSLLLAVAGATPDVVAATLDRFLVMEDADLASLEDCVWWQLVGVRSAEMAAELGERALAFGRISWTPLGGVALVAPRSAAPDVEAALAAAGAVLLTTEAWEPERIRLGLPLPGIDYDASDNPHAAGLERRAVSWSKGCYLGQEVVCMQDMRGKVKRRLVRLEFDEELELPRGSEVRAAPEGEPAGTVRSQAGRHAIASVKAPSDAPGTRVLVGDREATVRPLAWSSE